MAEIAIYVRMEAPTENIELSGLIIGISDEAAFYLLLTTFLSVLPMKKKSILKKSTAWKHFPHAQKICVGLSVSSLG